LSRPVDFLQHLAVAVDKHSQREPRCTQHALHLQAGIDELADGCVCCFQQPLRPVRIIIRRDADDRKIMAVTAPREAFQGRHFFPAGTAPARPNIDEQRPAVKRAQFPGWSVQALQRHVPQSYTDGRLDGAGDRSGVWDSKAQQN